MKKVIDQLSKVIDKKSNVPGFAYLKIQDGSISAINMNTKIKVFHEAFTNAPNVCIEYAKLKSIVTKLSAKTATFTSKGNKFVMQIGKNKFTFPNNNDMWDGVNHLVTGEMIENSIITADHIKKMKVASRFVPNDELRPVMEGVRLDNEGFIVASDPHRLYFDKSEKIFSENVIIRKEIIPLLTDQCIAFLHKGRQINNNLIVLKGENYEIITTPIEGHYPAWRNVVPDRSTGRAVKLNKSDFIESINAASLAAPKSGLIKLTTNKNNIKELIISSKDLDENTSFQRAISTCSTDNFQCKQIGLNYKYTLSILKNVDEDDIDFWTSSEDRAMLINNKFLLMPMLITD